MLTVQFNPHTGASTQPPNATCAGSAHQSQWDLCMGTALPGQWFGVVSAGTGRGEAGQVRRLCVLTELPREKELGCYSRAARGARSTGRLRGIG